MSGYNRGLMAPPTEARDRERVSTIDDLLEPLFGACKPASEFRIGAEAEKLGLSERSLVPMQYDGPRGVVAVMRELERHHGWRAEEGDGPLLALEKAGASVTLEPGAQLELSGAPLADVHLIALEFEEHMRELEKVSDALAPAFGGERIAWLGMGFHPLAKQADLSWVPKPRYGIMRRFLPARGAYGLDMMRRTATVQANFDYASEAHAMQCLRVGLRLAPFFTAMFASSPFYEGAPFGGKSYRARVWLDVEPARQGLVPAVLHEGSRFVDYVEWALDAPMFLLLRDGKVKENTGQSFRSFMKHGFEGELATRGDWVTHLNTLFPEVRLKRTLEIRGGDSLPRELVVAPSALFAGIFYDEAALAQAGSLTESFRHDELVELRRRVAERGLEADFRGRPAGEIASRMIEIAKGGLSRRARLANGVDEGVHLLAVERSTAKLRSPADDLLDRAREYGGGPDAVARASLEICRL